MTTTWLTCASRSAPGVSAAEATASHPLTNPATATIAANERLPDTAHLRVLRPAAAAPPPSITRVLGQRYSPGNRQATTSNGPGAKSRNGATGSRRSLLSLTSASDRRPSRSRDRRSAPPRWRDYRVDGQLLLA